MALSKLLAASLLVSILLLHNLTDADKSGALTNTTAGSLVQRIDCNRACEERCSKAPSKRTCRRACVPCCRRCNCVPPPGTSGNQKACPCYYNQTTHGSESKCP